ncbi:MAG: gamma-glutamylcyclotransferase [Acidimicrobiia bacterium]|nr:gamma-glutamylcyclotransferase [Acidimicrobiia bacterium]
MNLPEPRNAPQRTDESARRLAVYGSLAPGRPNHDQLAGLEGRWIEGTVRGELREEGWGAELGFPALVLDPAGSAISVRLFESPDLPAHWARLDAFEGSGYRRVATAVCTAEGELPASIYVLARN